MSEPDIDVLPPEDGGGAAMAAAVARIVSAGFSDVEGAVRFRNVVEQIPRVAVYIDVVIPDDPGHSIPVYISPQIEDMVGYPLAEWLGEGELWLQVLHPDDAERMRKLDEFARRDLTPLSAEYRMVTKSGRVIWVNESASVVVDPATGTRYWQGVMVDVTARKEAELELTAERERTAESLRAALTVQEEAAERLRALDEMKNAFLSAVSHELRTPLASVLGSALTLERLGLDLAATDQQELLHGVASSARRLQRLLEDLLDVDRLTRGVVEVNRSPVDLQELVREVAEALELAGHVVLLEVPPTRVEVDGPKVERIVENLVSNAIRHTPPGSTVWVRARRTGDMVELVVEDDGPGVPAGARAGIFEPFRQLNAVPHGPGLGIGLSLVARFAELHGGSARVEEREGGGASFVVCLALPAPAP